RDLNGGDTFTSAEYRKIQRLLYWYLTSKDDYIANTTYQRNGRTYRVSATNVYENVQRMIWELIRNGQYKNNINASNDPSDLWGLLYGDGSSTGLINSSQYDELIDSNLTFNLYHRPDSSVQNMISVSGGRPSASLQENILQIGNVPNTDLPPVEEMQLSLTKMWEDRDGLNRPESIELTLEKIRKSDGAVIGTKVIEVRAEDNWQYTSTSYTLTDNEGNPCEYRVKEAGEQEGKVLIGRNLYQVTSEINTDENGVNITVINKLIQNITQPSTGANSRWISMFGGTLMMMLSAVYFFMRAEKRRIKR
ncbi:MAG: Cna B-type domain-containing protein, partial [Lachnospiraceae bacterium]|nr:Cna B-type domain-containing protein [Lachnospiraceae bacterium]